MNISQNVVCVANRMFIKDCNTCWCNEDGTRFFCTRKVCVPELLDDASVETKPEDLRVIKRECRPDEVFELDCNMCRCNPDGKSFSCTRRACVDQVDEDSKNSSLIRKKRSINQVELKTCQPGLEFRIDCNTCLCDNDGRTYSCTRMDCTANNGAPPISSPGGVPTESSSPSPPKQIRETRSLDTPKTCQPDQEFRMDCNTCLCNSEGQDFSCTRIDCNALNQARSKRDTSERVAMVCPAGSVFNRDCNVCKCSDDGDHAVCTKNRCSQQKQEAETITTIPQTDPDYRCTPGEQFKRDCSDCSCAADGKSIYCTVRFCDQDYSPPAS